MRKFVVTLTVCAAAGVIACFDAVAQQTDSLSQSVVTAAPKDMTPLRRMSLSSSSFYEGELQESGLAGIKGISALAPGVFIPDYGSRLTTSVYIRGIGSRTGDSPVGMYVDGIPLSDKSAFDFLLSDVERIDVLRGPQSTLYGQNTMGGLIRVFTKDPRHHSGTDVRLGAATYGDFDAGVTSYHHFRGNVSAMTGVSYSRRGGYWRNEARGGEKVDDGDDLSARVRLVASPSEATTVDFNLHYSYTGQGGYPYYCGDSIAYNRRSSYRRNMLGAGLNVEHRMPDGTVLNSVTGLQGLADRMVMDQDFTASDIYSLVQRQRLAQLSQEFIARLERRGWRSVTGVSLQAKLSRTDGPVTFHKDGVQWLETLTRSMAERYLPEVESGAMTMRFSVEDDILEDDLAFDGRYKTPEVEAALFHQSDFTNLFGAEGLTATAGLRVDVRKSWLDYSNKYHFSHEYSLTGDLTMPSGSRQIPMVPKTAFDNAMLFDGDMHDTDFEFMPRLALQYDIPRFGSVYASVSRGYRSGGYNIQMFSEFLQTDMQNVIKSQIAQSTIPVVEGSRAIPDASKARILDVLAGMEQPAEQDIAGMVRYEPEHAWNYEAGSHMRLLGGRLYADMAVFWIETSDLQISQMAPSGLGRVTVNAGKSRSVGGELDVRASITDALSANVAYGYTHAKFRDERDSYVPFMPAHTLAANARYAWTLRGWVDSVILSGGWHGAGRIYWNEDNDAWQDFYGAADARLTFGHKGCSLTLWASNILNDRSQAFCFTSMGRQFCQYTRPFQAGLRADLHF